jgi:hypothetical protein
MKNCHSILVTYRLDKLQFYFENVKIAPYGGCHDAVLYTFDVTPMSISYIYRPTKKQESSNEDHYIGCPY